MTSLWSRCGRIGLALAMMAASAAAPAWAEPEMARTEAAITVPDLTLHVAALTSERMAGRLTGTPGERLATAYVAEAFSALGLAPGGEGGGFFQEFSFTAGVSLAEGNRLAVSIDGAERMLALDDAWRPLAFSETAAIGARQVVFAGYGVSTPAEEGARAIDSYGDLDVSGKWALVWRGLPSGLSRDDRRRLRRHADLRFKASEAKARGAVGVIFAPPMRDGFPDRLPPLRYSAVSGVSGLPTVAVRRAEGARLLEALGDAALAAMSARLEAGESVGAALPGVVVSGAVALAFESRAGRNVLGRLELDGRAEGGAPPLIVGAHVDHLGRGESAASRARDAERGQLHRGADDNASGVAALIEIAQLLAAERDAGRLTGARDVVFAAWSGEELGLLGAKRYARSLLKETGAADLSDQVSAYINMDMVGRLDGALTIAGLASSPIWPGEIARWNAAVGLSIDASDDPYLPTDSTVFYTRGAPVLSFFTGVHGDYHTPRDTADKLNYPGLRDVARLVARIARARAEDAAEPAFAQVARPRRGRRLGGVFLGAIPEYQDPEIAGLALAGVLAGGPAARAGLTEGDVIVGLAGQEISNVYDYLRVLNGLIPGEPAEITVARDGARRAFSVTPDVRD